MARWLLFASLMVAAGVRLWLSTVLPLSDTTEARYGEIVRIGLEHGFWLMPHMTASEPFFAKPPASTWLSMLAATALGLSEASLRLPSLLLMLGTALICARLAARESGSAPDAGLWAAAVVLLSPIGFVLAGAVMTDAVHVLAVTVAMAGATAVVVGDEHARRLGRGVFWAALGAGTLAKGLATVALAGLPVVLYGLATRRPLALARAFLAPVPILTAAAIALPWYVAAETAYPGFLRYFIVGEHLERFIEPGWQGDRYGTAHREAIGTIWAFAAAAAGPWLLAALALRVGRHASVAAERPRRPTARAAGALWWACWMLAPLLLFSFARNIIWTYSSTALAPFGVALAVALAGSPRRRGVAAMALAWTLALVAAAPEIREAVAAKSAKALLAQIPVVDPQWTMPVTVPGELRFSGAYYSDGRACLAANPVSEAACDAGAGGAGWRILRLDDARSRAASGAGEIVATHARHALLLRRRCPTPDGCPR
jgi:4-amino-4-deoxy-L-arabinose transferase-like glycosyltransferase